jgi:hypothetical protein
MNTLAATCRTCTCTTCATPCGMRLREAGVPDSTVANPSKEKPPSSVSC